MGQERPRVVVAPPDDQVRQALAADPLFGAYALGYLSPPWRAETCCAVALDALGRSTALAVRHDERPQPALLLFGAPRGLVAILGDPAMAAWRRELRVQGQEVWLTGEPAALEACAGFFYVLERRPLERHAATSAALLAAGSLSPAGARLLGIGEAPLLNRLYGLPADDPFAAVELARAPYYGVFVEDAAGRHCIAAAGTHVVVPAQRVAVIGNVFTAPEWRGRGHATACVAALCRHHVAEGYRWIALNVDPTNAPALRIYNRLGFQLIRAYEEVRAVAL